MSRVIRLDRSNALLREIPQPAESTPVEEQYEDVQSSSPLETDGPMVDFASKTDPISSLCPFCGSRPSPAGEPCCSEWEAITLADSVDAQLGGPLPRPAPFESVVAVPAAAASAFVAKLNNASLLLVALLAASIGAIGVLVVTRSSPEKEFERFERWQAMTRQSGVPQPEGELPPAVAPAAPRIETEPAKRAPVAPAPFAASAPPVPVAPSAEVAGAAPAVIAPAPIEASQISPPAETAAAKLTAAAPSSAPPPQAAALPETSTVRTAAAPPLATEPEPRVAERPSPRKWPTPVVGPTLASDDERTEWMGGLKVSPDFRREWKAPMPPNPASGSALARVSPRDAEAADPRWNRIRRGMTKEAVRTILGDPKGKEDNSLAMEFWLYTEDADLSRAWVAFSRSDGRVFNWQKP